MSGRAGASWAVNRARDHAWTCGPVPNEAREFHRSLPGYAPTVLAGLPSLARELGVGRVFAKDESSRLGLPAFKALGASWAIHRVLRGRPGHGGEAGPASAPLTIVTATDGNHGRAVARFAREFGHRAHIFVPDGVHPAAVQAIRDEGAAVTHVPGSYEAAVGAAARSASEDGGALLVQDTAWDGYEDVPGWIVEGYSTLFAEIDDQLRGQGVTAPDLVVVPSGVGSLLQAALVHYRSEPGRLNTAVVSVEPVEADCALASVTAGRPVTVRTGQTIMAGLNCGTLSTLAWPYISRGLDACVRVTDRQAAAAARDLAALGVSAGPCGAAPLAAVRILTDARDSSRSGPRSDGLPRLVLSPAATVVLLVTEGAAANPAVRPA